MTEEGFWKRVAKTESCWLWTAGTNDGYGMTGTKFRGNRRAHRIAWELLRGAIPAGKVLDHLCRNRRCVNPDHLRLVTPGENTMAGMSFGAINAHKSICKRGHELTGENVYHPPHRPGQRSCRKCMSLLRKRWQRKNPEKHAEQVRARNARNNPKRYKARPPEERR